LYYFLSPCYIVHVTICPKCLLPKKKKKKLLSSVADNWGVWMYALYLFLLTIWWSINWDEASACPYTHMEDVVIRKKSLIIAFLSICAELAGGLVIFKYIQILWAFQFASTHKNRAYGDCTTDLQARPNCQSSLDSMNRIYFV